MSTAPVIVYFFPIPANGELRKVQRMKRAENVFLFLSRSRCRWRVGKSILLRFPVPPHERVLEHVIRHTPALSYTLGLVKRPMDTEVDAALAVLFLGLRER